MAIRRCQLPGRAYSRRSSYWLGESVQTVCNRSSVGGQSSAPHKQMLFCLGVPVERNDLPAHIAVICGKDELSGGQLPGDEGLPLDLSLHDGGRRILRQDKA